MDSPGCSSTARRFSITTSKSGMSLLSKSYATRKKFDLYQYLHGAGGSTPNLRNEHGTIALEQGRRNKT